jgi:hypothetical protein
LKYSGIFLKKFDPSFFWPNARAARQKTRGGKFERPPEIKMARLSEPKIPFESVRNNVSNASFRASF